MVLQIELPDDVTESLTSQWDDLPRRVLQSLAIEAYNEGALTEYQVQRLLSFRPRDEVEAFLKKKGAAPAYTLDDLQEDLETHRRVGTVS